MRVLITGSTGFLGSGIARACVGSGFEVLAIRRPSSSLARLDGIVEHIRFFDNTEQGIDDALSCAGGCDSIIHSATSYGRQGESATTLLETNTLFPLILLQKAETYRVKQFINIDTALDSDVNAYALSKRQFSDWGYCKPTRVWGGHISRLTDHKCDKKNCTNTVVPPTGRPYHREPLGGNHMSVTREMKYKVPEALIRYLVNELDPTEISKISLGLSNFRLVTGTEV